MFNNEPAFISYPWRDEQRRRDFRMLLLNMAIAVVLACKLFAAGIAPKRYTCNMDGSIMPIQIFPKGKAFCVSTIGVLALERPLVRVNMLTELFY